MIPTLLWKNFGLVKGKAFDSWRRVGSVLPAIKVYNRREVDELILVDICSTTDNTNFDFKSLSNFADDCFVPLSAGGGIKNVDEVQSFLNNGADKVTVNSEAYSNKKIISEIAKKFGSQCVVSSIDVKRKDKDSWTCFSHSGKIQTKYEVSEWVKEVQDLGAGEILITSIDNDGMMCGYDLDLMEKISTICKVPVIASGGAGSYGDIVDVVKKTEVSAVAAASIFHFTQLTPAGAKRALKDAGVNVRENFEEI